MKAREISFLTAVLWTLISISGEQVSVDNAPRIITNDGNLMFQTGNLKSIHFDTQGNGNIRFNDIDIRDFYGKMVDMRSLIDQNTNRNNNQCDCTAMKLTIASNTQKIKNLKKNLKRTTDQMNRIAVLVNDLKQISTIDECISNPCHNGGTCIDGFGKYKCICTEQYQGVNCMDDVNECFQLAGTDQGCQNNAQCENYYGGFRCICPVKWSGVLCNILKNGCTGSSNVELCGHGICLADNTNSDTRLFKCLCNHGWSLDPLTKTCIVDIDECSVGRYPCSLTPLVPCLNTAGSFTCSQCPSGYVGNGFSCSDVDECLSLNTCAINQVCVNTLGSFKCQCAAGMTVNQNGVCQRLNICQSDNGGCSNNAQCRQNSFNDDGRTCTCNSGFVGSGIGLYGCSVRTVTNNTNVLYRLCLSLQMCRNGGLCQQTETGFVCHCAQFFAGNRCQVQILNRCNENPCQNNGICSFVEPDSYRCQCSPSYTGLNCETEHAECGGTIVSPRNAQNISLFMSRGHSTSFRYPCTWIILVSETQFIQVTPILLLLRGPCSQEHVRILEKSSSDIESRELGKFCSDRTQASPNGYNTTGNILIIKAQLQNDLLEWHGFLLQVTAFNYVNENVDCCRCLNEEHVVTTQSNGIFQSPHFPLSYSERTNCVIVYERPLGHRQKVEISINIMDLGDSNGNCSNTDFVQINFVERGRILITACNQVLYQNQKYLTSSFAIQFHSDNISSQSLSRFQIVWKETLNNDPCGSVMSFQNSGIVEAPSLSENEEAYCTWSVHRSNLSQMIALKGFFNNWQNGDCSVHIWIINVDLSGSESQLWESCQTATMLDEMNEEISGELGVIFRKPLGISTPSFRIKATYICGKVINMDQITNIEIQTPNYPDMYENELNCVFIFVAKTRSFSVDFVDIDINDNFPCSWDFLEIKDATKFFSNGRFCNGNMDLLIPVDKEPSSENLVINFRTNSSIAGRGFRALVTLKDCGGSYFLRNRLVISYPEDHRNSTNSDIRYQMNKLCVWNIISLPGMNIQTIFDHFHLENHANCLYDYLSLSYDNVTDRKFCGNEISNFKTRGNKIKLVFKSDHSISGEGFIMRAYTRFVRRNCDQEIIAENGIISSPAINSIARPYVCIYTIIVPQGRKVIINVTLDGVAQRNQSILNLPTCFARSQLRITNGLLGSTKIADVCPEMPPREEFITSFNKATLHYKVPFYGVRSEFNFTIMFRSIDEQCGSIHTDEAGEIASPNYPLYAPINTYCQWEIRTSPGKRIKIRISHVRSGYLTDTQNCNADKDPIIKLITLSQEIFISCEKDIEKIFKFDEDVRIIFKNLAQTQNRFRLAYRISCFIPLNSFHGRIENANSNRYPRNLCSWTINILRGNSLMLQFDQFDLPNEPCTSFVNITDGRNTLLQNRCGSTLINNTFQTSNSPVKIVHYIDRRISSNILQAHKGIVLEYNTEGCVTNINYDPDDALLYRSTSSKRGNISSPQYPNSVSNVDCIWTFKSVNGYSVKLTFDVIELDNFQNCTQGEILIARDTEDQNERSVFSACHRISGTNPLIYQSSQNYLFLKFSSAKDSNGGQRKFHATYEFINSSCSYEITATEGIIKSPNYPKVYPMNINCQWNIHVRQGMSIHLHFLDLQIEGSSCRYDYVELFSDLNSETRPMTRLCGDQFNSSQLYQSLSNQMLITFKTDSSVQRRGFKAHFFEGCGGQRMATEVKKYLYSPNYPHQYILSDSVCEWTISANISNPGERIFFYFLGFEGDSSVNCSLDTTSQSDNSLTIIDGLEETPIKARLCSSQHPPPILSSGFFLKVRLRSTTGRAIFKAGYGTGNTACGGEYFLDNGIFTSPFYPNAVSMDMDCTYIITTTPGSEIDLTIDEFVRTNEYAYDLMDFLEIRIGNSSRNTLVGRFYTHSDIENATRNVRFNDSLLVRFRSQGGQFTNAIKFLARYHINYILEFQSEDGTLGSPQYGHMYKDDTRITWTINPLSVQFIDLQFQSFSVGRKLINNDCIEGKLSITDGDGNSILLCGSDIPLKAKFAVPLTIILIAEGFRYPGFLLRWSPSANESFTKIGNCKYIIQATSVPQILSSPNFPNFDPINRDCEWTIVAPKDKAIELEMLNFTLENSVNCKYDNFTITLRGLALLSQNIIRARILNEERIFCGTQNNSILDFAKDIYFNRVTIKFKVDIYDIFPGFQLRYNLKCHQVIRSSEGLLKNDEFPNHMTEFKNCTYILKIRGGRYFLLNFTSISLPPKTNDQCEDGYIEISTDRSLGKYCGSDIPTTLTPLNTERNIVLIRLVGHFDRYPTYSGFQMKYGLNEVEDCGGRHILSSSDDSITIKYPESGVNSPHYIECKWYILSPYGTKMKIDLVDVSINGNCTLSYLSFFDGSTLLARKIGNKNYCKTESSLFTSGKNLIVLFRNIDQVGRFQIKVSVGPCGGNLYKASGIITSPHYPHTYPTPSKCLWTIKLPRLSSAVIILDDVDIGNDCSRTNISISSVEDISQTNWSSCAGSLSTIHIDGSAVQILFTSTTSGQGRGFKLSFSSRRLSCSSSLSDPSGEVMSTNYPQSMPSGLSCFWRINADVDKRVTIKIRKLTLGEGCFIILGGQAETIKRICGSNRENLQIITNSSSVLVYIQSRSGSSVSFTYHTDEPSLCGSHIYPQYNRTGIITFNGNSYLTVCRHIVHNFPEATGTVIFRLLNTTGLNCQGDTISFKSVVIDDIGENSVVDQRSYCDLTEGRKTFQTLGKLVDVEYKVSRLYRRSNHSATVFYQFQNCGGILTDGYGYITSPNYPNKYPHNTYCDWILKAPNDMHIKMVVQTLHLENHSTCRFDYLYIRSGPEFDSPPMTTFCGKSNITNETIIYRKNIIRLSFKSDSSSAENGFFIQYTFIAAADNCNGFIYNISGSIQSPNYPRPYPSNTNCNWTIIVPQGYQVELTVQDRFDLEIDRNGKCTYDALEIVDSNQDVIIARLCGHVPPPKPIMSIGNRVGLIFTSDHNLNLDGFHVIYKSVCGGVFNGTYGSFGSPKSFIETSRYIALCQYVIPVWKNRLTVLRITASLKQCRYSKQQLRIYMEIQPGNFVLHQSICGQNSRVITIISTQNILIKYNITYRDYKRYFFKATYLHDETIKEYNNITVRKRIQTPQFPNPYHHNAELMWKFRAPDNYIFYIELRDMDIEESNEDCLYDFVAFYNTDIANSSNLVQKFCGIRKFPIPFKINSSVIMIHFVSDQSHYANHTGFVALIIPTPGPRLGCGGEIILEPNSVGSIISVDLNNDGNYDNNLFCEWRLFTSQTHTIHIRFENNSVALERRQHQKCRYDWLNVYDGPHQGSPLMYSFCGNDNVDPITSTSNSMFIIFQTDSSITGRGFKIFYSVQHSLNNFYLNATSEFQTVTSLGYPDSTNFNFKGMVVIMSPTEAQHIQLELKELSVRTTVNCSLDSLIIRDSSMIHVNQIRQFCKPIQFPIPFISSDTSVLIVFQIGSSLDQNSVSPLRYKIDYKIFNCNRTEKAYSGRILNIESLKQSSYSHNVTCQLSLEAPSLNLKYQFYFKRLALERSQTCRYDYIEFTFGRSGNVQNTLPRICGRNLPPSFVSNSSFVTMKFVTDASISSDGYDITYVVNKDPLQKCGGDIDIDSGVVTSPGFGRNLYEDGQCIWNIAIVSGSVLSWKISDLQLGPDLEYGARCNSTTDYIQVTSDESTFKFCGNFPPTIDFEIPSRRITVKYLSLAGGTGTGFRLEWKSVAHVVPIFH